MESSFGRDFGSVRMHTGAGAAESASSIGAAAYTYGNHVVMGGHAPDQSTPAGQQLLAHELTHVVQQTGGEPVVRRGIIGDIANVVLGPAAPVVTNLVSSAVSTVVNTAVSSLADLIGIQQPRDGSPAALQIILDALNTTVVRTFTGVFLPPGTDMMLRGMMEFLRLAWDIFANPGPYIAQIQQGLGNMVGQAGPMATATATAVTPASAGEGALDCVLRHLEPKIEYLGAHWWEVLKGMAWDMLWPWPGVGEDLGHCWTHIQLAASSAWSLQINDAVDHLMAVLRYANAALGRLYGWFFIASVLIGTALGAIAGAAVGGAGAGPGALAGAGSGLAFAGEVGMGLMIATLIIEGASILKAAGNLAFADRTEEQRECDCEIISSSSLTFGITGAMAILSAIASRFAKAIVTRVFNRVWRRPVLRGRGRRSRGDVLADRFALSELVRARFNQFRVTITDALARLENFRGLDLTVDSRVTVRLRSNGQAVETPSALRSAFANREPLAIDINGGNVVQVKSHGPGATNTIIREIGDVASFNQGTFPHGHTVTVTNPGTRTLVVFLQEALSATDDAAVRAAAAASNPPVALQLIVGGTPPNHPAVVAIDAMPGILSEMAGTGTRDGLEDAPGLPETIRCP